MNDGGQMFQIFITRKTNVCDANLLEQLDVAADSFAKVLATEFDAPRPRPVHSNVLDLKSRLTKDSETAGPPSGQILPSRGA